MMLRPCVEVYGTLLPVRDGEKEKSGDGGAALRALLGRPLVFAQGEHPAHGDRELRRIRHRLRAQPR